MVQIEKKNRNRLQSLVNFFYFNCHQILFPFPRPHFSIWCTCLKTNPFTSQHRLSILWFSLSSPSLTPFHLWYCLALQLRSKEHISIYVLLQLPLPEASRIYSCFSHSLLLPYVSSKSGNF